MISLIKLTMYWWRNNNESTTKLTFSQNCSYNGRPVRGGASAAVLSALTLVAASDRLLNGLYAFRVRGSDSPWLFRIAFYALPPVPGRGGSAPAGLRPYRDRNWLIAEMEGLGSDGVVLRKWRGGTIEYSGVCVDSNLATLILNQERAQTSEPVECMDFSVVYFVEKCLAVSKTSPGIPFEALVEKIGRGARSNKKNLRKVLLLRCPVYCCHGIFLSLMNALSINFRHILSKNIAQSHWRWCWPSFIFLQNGKLI